MMCQQVQNFLIFVLGEKSLGFLDFLQGHEIHSFFLDFPWFKKENSFFSKGIPHLPLIYGYSEPEGKMFYYNVKNQLLFVPLITITRLSSTSNNYIPQNNHVHHNVNLIYKCKSLF